MELRDRVRERERERETERGGGTERGRRGERTVWNRGQMYSEDGGMDNAVTGKGKKG